MAVSQDFIQDLTALDVLNEVCLGRPTGNEENIKIKIVAPILELLGYDPVREFDYERHVESGRPDIVLLIGGKPKLIVEAKGLDKDLSDFKVQGLEYSDQARVPWTILTNGTQWDLYKTFIEGVNHEDNEPILTVFSQEFPDRFDELKALVGRAEIKHIEKRAKTRVGKVRRKAQVADLARILQNFRSQLFWDIRKQFDSRYESDKEFTDKIDRWAHEQAIDRDYDWYHVFKEDKKFRAYILQILRRRGHRYTKSKFESVYRKSGRDETSRKFEDLFRNEGIPVDWKDKLCFEGAYALINRILFLRMCEDTGLITKEITDSTIKKIREASSQNVLAIRLENLFSEMRNKYPGIYELPLLDHMEVSDLEWDGESIAGLCEESMKYDFAKLGDVLV